MPPPSALHFSFSFLTTPSLCRPNHQLHSPLKFPSAQLRPPRHISPTAGEQASKPSSLNNPPPWLITDDSDALKMPTAPWMTSPLLLPQDQVLDLSNPHRSAGKKKRGASPAYRSLTEKVRGGRSRHAMLGIVRNIKNLRKLDPPELHTEDISAAVADEEQAVELDVPLKPAEGVRGQRAPWVAAEEKLVFKREKKMKEVTAAELTLAPELLFRLRGKAKRMTKWVKAKKAGVTLEVVKEIQRGWRENELVMVRIVEPLRRNMDRAREIIETKTGGLAVWRERDFLVVYRGEKCQNFLNSPSSHNDVDEVNHQIIEENSAITSANPTGIISGSIIRKDGELKNIHLTDMNSKIQDLAEGSLYEREANRLLNGLGPRFVDWWWQKPLPVDADLLPEVVPNFRPPLRMCPPGVRAKLTDDELTYLRKLARPLPTHFALGRNTKLQGLAASIIKLWKKSLIAKIAVKVGVQNTNSEQMSLELKRLTGGVLILRNKFFIILYRGKDFLPDGVANLIDQREAELNEQQRKEEEARMMSTNSFHAMDVILSKSSNIGTYMEFQDIQGNHIPLNNQISSCQIQIAAEKEKLEKELREHESKLFILKQKIEKSEKKMSKLSLSWHPSEQSVDQEVLTEEERQAFRKVGLEMDEIILLGRRGIYSGVIGSIHQHWKHREVVKVITKQKLNDQINYTAKLLEVESGGILVAVEKLRTCHAIIIYRGKNYARPLTLPTNLTSKREAFQRSIEIQRRGSMKYFAREKEKLICELKQRLRDLERENEEIVPMDQMNIQQVDDSL
ncbi:chloroplastic group IIA intron splicing facilitator CRS1, chloroplastic isoform X2 [Canna indica]|uniref:Chloroplastic group IIA intron splicing facilitator CRS1, chloroplastic isoform X2 n=1 Tax=Canna indica TaxID=4628 RepID=A0AAQ3JMY9_9LILI|nr:chloroplastic group IIA intron splicing facilitator CRS1, chloroplastic isoform X2 [Canna indica]